MQAQNNKNNIKAISFGCRLNALEAEKIKSMLYPTLHTAIVVNSCAVTAEAERQAGQFVRKLARENPNAPIFVTGCAATRNPDLFTQIQNAFVISNFDKMKLSAYVDALNNAPCHKDTPKINQFNYHESKLSKQFVQIQNGCNHNCAYCVTRLLRGRSVSFAYDDILRDVRCAVDDGFYEIVLTGIDIASFAHIINGVPFLISDLCRKLLADVPEIQRLRLSSMDPASPEIFKIIELMRRDSRMMPHMHLSMQSGSDTILASMRRRHNADMVRRIFNAAPDITFSWDIICGFAGETDKLFQETLDLVNELKPIKIHAFPFSPRPNTDGATMPNQVNRSVSKERVKIISDAADAHRNEFMKTQIGKSVQVLVEENNIARDPHDISVKIIGEKIPPRRICNVVLSEIDDDMFIGKIA